MYICYYCKTGDCAKCENRPVFSYCEHPHGLSAGLSERINQAFLYQALHWNALKREAKENE